MATAQPSPTDPPRIGLLACGKWECNEPSLLEGLAEFGYRPGETITIDCLRADASDDRLPAVAAELVRLGVDVIVSFSQPAGRAALQATEAIPIVTVISGDPIAGGFARSLANPGGNVTGVSYYATELTAKRLELLKQMLPGVSAVEVLANPKVSYLPFEEDTKQAAARLDVALRFHYAEERDDLASAFAAMQAEGGQAVFVLPDLMLAVEASQISALALEHRLPTMAWGHWYTQSGSLMAYSARYEELIRRLAFYVDRILKGAKPGDLPIEQPATFDLSINLKTADALGIEVPEELLLLADEIIE